MSPILKFSAIAVKMASGVLLAADAVSSTRPLVGVIVSALSLIPLALALQDILGPDQRIAQIEGERAVESGPDVLGA